MQCRTMGRCSNGKCEMFNEKLFSSRNWAETVSLICGASKSTVLRGRKGNSENNGNTLRRKEIKLDDFDKRAMSRLVLSLYKWKPLEIPTFTTIYEESSKISGFPQIGRILLHKELKKLGFVYKLRNIKMQVYQRLDTVSWPRGRNM